MKISVHVLLGCALLGAASLLACAPPPVLAPPPEPRVSAEVARLVAYVELPATEYLDKDCPHTRYLGPDFPKTLREAVAGEIVRLGGQATVDPAAPHDMVVWSTLSIDACLGGRACGSFSVSVERDHRLVSRKKAALPEGPGVVGICDGTLFSLIPKVATRRTLPEALAAPGLTDSAAEPVLGGLSATPEACGGE